MSDYLTTGPKVREFEEKFAHAVGAKYAVAVANGTAALHIACLAAEIQGGDEVITSAITFAASANAALYCQAKPVFADIDRNTYNIDPQDIKRKITARTKAIIPVHLTGEPCDMGQIHQIATEHNLMVIEDAAHALGAKYKGNKVGSLSPMTEFSLHPVKNMTTGEGGVLTTEDERLYKKICLYRTHGITRNADDMIENHGPWYYEQLNLGYNYRITDIQCALGISQLDKLNSFNLRRQEIVDRYDKELPRIDGIKTKKKLADTVSGNHLYIIELESDKLTVGRKEVFQALQAENIGVNVHYLPVYRHPYYQKLGYQQGLCPHAEDLYSCMLTIPLFPAMSDDDVSDVITAVNKVVQYYRK
jgi:UDP-4-amino-4,6-dideoxy-N-acetyl-beta-L-altrosamine transaminase